MQITVNLTGTFEGRSLHTEVILEFSDKPSLKDLLKRLNKEYHMKVFSKRGMRSNFIVIMINGTRVHPNEISEIRLGNEDTITIVQPIQGG